MLKREIKYEDFDGNKTSEIFYFNLSKPELIELELEVEQGYGKMLTSIIETKNNKALIQKFKELVLMSYGQKSDDGKRFIKTDKLREEFSQTAAYSELFMELATDDNAAVTFLTGILPREMRNEIEKAVPVVTEQFAQSSPPVAPTPPSN